MIIPGLQRESKEVQIMRETQNDSDTNLFLFSPSLLNTTPSTSRMETLFRDKTPEPRVKIQSSGSKYECNGKLDSGRLYQFIKNRETLMFSGGATRLVTVDRELFFSATSNCNCCSASVSRQ